MNRRAELRTLQRKGLQDARWHATSALVSMTLALIALGLAIICAGLIYGWVGWRSGNAGKVAHTAIWWLLGLWIPCLVVLAMAITAYDGFITLQQTTPSADEPLPTFWGEWGRRLFWESGLYQRLGTLLLALVPLAAVAVDIFGDIIFWTSGTRRNERQTFREVVRARFGNLINHLTSAPIATLNVITHSQGTVVAVDYFLDLPEDSLRRINLITMGSPLATLYAPLLGLYTDEHCAPLVRLASWHNYYRHADYIGGRIDYRQCHNDEPPGIGSHTGYWTEANPPWLERLRSWPRQSSADQATNAS
jgi:hypothetical protein